MKLKKGMTKKEIEKALKLCDNEIKEWEKFRHLLLEELIK